MTDHDPGLRRVLDALTPDDLDQAIAALTPPEPRRLAVLDGGCPPGQRERSRAELHILQGDVADEPDAECDAGGDR